MPVNKEEYQKRKKAGLCTCCRENKAVPTMTRCPYCADKANRLRRIRHRKDPSHRNKQNQEFKKKCREEGRCPACGNLKEGKGIRCQNCAEHLTEGIKGTDFTLFYPGGKYENYNNEIRL